MKTRLNQIIFFMFLILCIQACSVKQSDIKSVAQTNSATQIEEFKTEILKDLIIKKKCQWKIRFKNNCPSLNFFFRVSYAYK